MPEPASLLLVLFVIGAAGSRRGLRLARCL
ncbi:PEP-CTERM sorting domain-containing protein [Aeoliella mucimassa]